VVPAELLAAAPQEHPLCTNWPSSDTVPADALNQEGPVLAITLFGLRFSGGLALSVAVILLIVAGVAWYVLSSRRT
jgi:hypothetical protein